MMMPKRDDWFCYAVLIAICSVIMTASWAWDVRKQRDLYKGELDRLSERPLNRWKKVMIRIRDKDRKHDSGGYFDLPPGSEIWSEDVKYVEVE
jgi:hypothetical protein